MGTKFSTLYEYRVQRVKSLESRGYRRADVGVTHTRPVFLSIDLAGFSKSLSTAWYSQLFSREGTDVNLGQIFKI